MLDRIRSHLTYSNVMVTLLAFVVIGGGGFALGGVINQQGEITGCYDKKGSNRGELRLLVKGKCTRGEKQIAWNQRGVPGQQGEQGPPGPATGAAGGDLTGSYPNPQVAPNAVNGPKIADASVGQADLGNDSVGAGELVDLKRREATASFAAGVAGGAWNHNSATASCNAGEQLIAGNAAWDTEVSGDQIAIVEINPNYATNSVSVTGASDATTEETLRAIAICL